MGPATAITGFQQDSKTTRADTVKSDPTPVLKGNDLVENAPGGGTPVRASAAWQPGEQGNREAGAT